MYEIEKLKNHFKLKTFHDAHLQKAYENLAFENVRFDCNKKYLNLFELLKERNNQLVKQLSEHDFKDIEFIAQQICMGSFSLGLECVATYTKNIEIYLSKKEYPDALAILEKYLEYEVFENAEKAIQHYIASLPTDFETDLQYISFADVVGQMIKIPPKNK